MEKRFSTEKVQRLIIIVLAAALAAAIFVILQIYREKDVPSPGPAAVIEEYSRGELTDNADGQIRIKINPVVEVKNGVMSNLNFANLNKDRMLRCRIIFKEKCIYDSGMIAEGDVLKGDYIGSSDLSEGSNDALAEVYSYNADGNLLGQTNVKVILNSNN